MNHKVTPYFLSCKRFELFEQTFKSFWDKCDDKNLIESFIIIDDNSSKEDRSKIIDLASQITLPNLFVAKNQIKGQATSLNIFYDLCRTKYAIAIEDDWKFIRNGNFIKDSIEIMSLHDNIKRVCVDLSSSGKQSFEINDEEIYSINNEKYYINEYNNKREWPSFTFRQCIIDVESCYKNIGYVNSLPKLSHDGSTPTAETDYAVRYCNFGYRTAFFIDSYVEEISKNYPSSFDLNSVNRHKEYDY
jgi:hypothetical protein